MTTKVIRDYLENRVLHDSDIREFYNSMYAELRDNMSVETYNDMHDLLIMLESALKCSYLHEYELKESNDINAIDEYQFKSILKAIKYIAKAKDCLYKAF